MTQPARFEVVRKLADGGVAEVLLAKDAATRSQVVLKILRPELTSDAAVVGRFLDEARVCQKLDHPNVIRHLAADRFSNGRVYLVTEFLEGVDLAAHLRLHGPLGAEELVKLAVPLCDALHYVHRHGVVHRDLKPENVFLAGGLGAFTPKLLDFGLANFQGAKSVRTVTGVILATPEYTPPECIDGKKADARSDLYSLGVLLYEALTGSPPFIAGNYGELLLKHLSEPPPSLPESAAELTPVIHRCLAKNPADRFGTAAEVGAALAEALRTPVERTYMSNPGNPVVSAKATVELQPELAETFGVYKTVKVLGEGAMGRVYLAKHSKLGRQVALKMMRPEHARDTELVQRFFQEARTVNEINHEHIVEIFDFAEETDASGNPRVYCVMELLSGSALSELIRYENLSIARILNIGRQLSSALAAAHRVGVVHRDIKPDNIFITARSGVADYVKVLDFGVAKLVKPIGDSPKVGTMAGAIIGTPAYMAPEQASGAGADFRADIYAAGVVLYELLTGRVPFEGSVFGQLVVQIMTKPPPPLPATSVGGEPIPPAMVELVMRCLAKEPSERPASMDELGEALAQISGEVPPGSPGMKSTFSAARTARMTPVPATGAAESVVLPPGAKRPGWLLPSLAGGIAVVAAGLYFGLFRAPPAPPEPAPAPPPVAAPAPAPVPELPAQVGLIARSKPPGARVTRADTGEELGTTPLTTRVARADGQVRLRFELPGHASQEEEVDLSRDAMVSVALLPAGRSRPPPAKSSKPAKKRKVSDDGVIDPFSD